MHTLAKGYQGFIRFFSNFQSLFLFLVRIIWGHQFFITGLGKFSRIEATAQFFHSLHIPLPIFSAYLVATIELVGGILLIVGLGSRLAAFLLAIIMFIAMSTAHAHVFSNWKFISDPSLVVQQAPFPFLMACLIVLFFGPGKISLDAWIKRAIERRHNF